MTAAVAAGPAVVEQSRPDSSRLLASDVLRLGFSGLVARPTRAILSALGIAIGIAAMIAVVGISSSSQAQLAATLDRLGTNLLTAAPGQSLFGDETPLPYEVGGLVGRVDGVEGVGTTGILKDVHAYRSAATLKTASPLVSVLRVAALR